MLILLSRRGMGMMVSAGDLLSLYVGLELQSLAAYVLASFMRRDDALGGSGAEVFRARRAAPAASCSTGSAWSTGSAARPVSAGIAEAYAGDARRLGLLFGLVFVFAGLAFKISAVPFHMWTPDVYEGAPTPVTPFFASAPKVAAMAMAVRVAVRRWDRRPTTGVRS